MQAAVYHGRNQIRIESVPVPTIGKGEVLVRVDTCGVCATDLKKIEYGTVKPPRVFGHEIGGVIEQVGAGVKKWRRNDRVAVFHHIPCRKCFYCQHKDYAQCAVYKKTGTTAAYEPAGGGFAEYIRVMPWIVREGMVKLPKKISFEEASFLEPVNTCVKGMERLEMKRGDVVLIFGQGPIGLIFTQLVKLEKGKVVALDLISSRLKLAKKLGASQIIDPRKSGVQSIVDRLTKKRGADAAILTIPSEHALHQALQLVRPGGKVMLFAHTRKGDDVSLDAGAVCVDEKTVLGSYSASVDVERKVEKLIFSRKLKIAPLISHSFPLSKAREAFKLAANPTKDSLKILIKPGRKG
jgi:L-iditol 2-dehydrogenase